MFYSFVRQKTGWLFFKRLTTGRILEQELSCSFTGKTATRLFKVPKMREPRMNCYSNERWDPSPLVTSPCKILGALPVRQSRIFHWIPANGLECPIAHPERHANLDGDRSTAIRVPQSTFISMAIARLCCALLCSAVRSVREDRDSVFRRVVKIIMMTVSFTPELLQKFPDRFGSLSGAGACSQWTAADDKASLLPSLGWDGICSNWEYGPRCPHRSVTVWLPLFRVSWPNTAFPPSSVLFQR